MKFMRADWRLEISMKPHLISVEPGGDKDTIIIIVTRDHVFKLNTKIVYMDFVPRVDRSPMFILSLFWKLRLILLSVESKPL